MSETLLASRRLAAIVESSEDAIVAKDLNGVITAWNRAAERMFGYTPAEAIGQSIRIIVPDDLQDEETAILERMRRGDRSNTSRPSGAGRTGPACQSR